VSSFGLCLWNEKIDNRTVALVTCQINLEVGQEVLPVSAEAHMKKLFQVFPCIEIPTYVSAALTGNTQIKCPPKCG
jgi:hypothetical protein